MCEITQLTKWKKAINYKRKFLFKFTQKGIMEWYKDAWFHDDLLNPKERLVR